MNKISKNFTMKLIMFIIVILLIFSYIIYNLYDLQIKNGDYYTQKADNNFIKTIVVKSKRGNIFDKNGVVLAQNKTLFELYVISDQLDEYTIDFLKKNIDFPLKKKINFDDKLKEKKTILLKKKLNDKELSLLESRGFKLKGIKIKEKVYRYYPQKNITSHIVGYINSINKKEYEKNKNEYNINDKIGKIGAEKYLESILKGKNGQKAVLYNKNREIEKDESLNKFIKMKNSENKIQEGMDVYLTIDFELQKKIDEIFLDVKSGAAVVIDLKTGDLLASYSKPTFDPNKIIEKNKDYIKEIFNDKYQATLDKTQKQFFPGSIFKVITSIAALDLGIIHENEKLLCPGYEEYGKSKFRCWNRGGHGELDLLESLAQSCDVYFYKLAKLMGLNEINKYAKKLSVGSNYTDYIKNIPKGFVPNEEWYKKKYGHYQKGTALNTSIGQGDVYLSPFKVAEIYSILANLGIRKKINILKKIKSKKGKIKYSRKIISKKTDIPIEIFKKINDGLKMVVENGTAKKFAIENFPVSGKTGTAQVRSKTKDEYNFEMAWEEKHHGWFVGFAPSYNPEIVVSVIVEHGGSSSSATPLVMKIIKKYYDIKY